VDLTYLPRAAGLRAPARKKPGVHRRRRAERRGWLASGLNPQFQMTLILCQVGAISAAFSLLGLAVARALTRLQDTAAAAGLKPGGVVARALVEEAKALRWVVVAAMLAAIVLSVLCTLLLTRKLTGPLNRMRAHFQSLCMADEGATGPLRFRRDDFYGDLPGWVNGAVARITRSGPRALR
jgi:hypothetical protein